MIDSSIFFGVASISYIIAMMLYITYLAFKKHFIGILATTLTIIGFLSHTAAFFIRWKEFNDILNLGLLRSVPLTNLYESLIFFVWCLILGYLIIETKYKTRSFGAFILPIAGIFLSFLDISGTSKEIHPLVPALQSNWLLAHVTMSFIAYSTFAIAFSTSIMYLILTTKDKLEPSYIFWTSILGIFISILIAMALDFVVFKVVAKSSESFIKNYLFKASFRSDSIFISLLSYLLSITLIFIIWKYGYVFKKLISSFSISEDLLDTLTYKSIAIGFPIFTLGGLIFGAIWADQAWGKYWTWDPKETWSLITWFTYAFFLHCRFIKGWRGHKTAIMAIVGFISTIFTYLGVNLLLSGLHSYGGM